MLPHLVQFHSAVTAGTLVITVSVSSPDGGELLQGPPDELRSLGLRAVVEHGAHGIFRHDRSIPESDQRPHRILGSTDTGSGRLEGQPAEAVLQLQYETLGFLATDTPDRAQGSEVAREDTPHRALGSKRREQSDGELGTKPARAQQPLKHEPFCWPVEAEERPAVFLDDELGVKVDPSAGRRQSLRDARAAR